MAVKMAAGTAVGTTIELALELGRVELGWDRLEAGVRERRWGTAVGSMIGAG
jgi:hypothetical protein